MEDERLMVDAAIRTYARNAERIERFRRKFSPPNLGAVVRPVTPQTIAEWDREVLDVRVGDQLRVNIEDQWCEVSRLVLTRVHGTAAEREILRQTSRLFLHHFFGIPGTPRDVIVLGNIVGFDGQSFADTMIPKRETPAPTQPAVANNPCAKPAAVKAPSRAGGAVAQVWAICDANRGASKRDLVKLCTDAGINENTAKTQVYRWGKANP